MVAGGSATMSGALWLVLGEPPAASLALTVALTIASWVAEWVLVRRRGDVAFQRRLQQMRKEFAQRGYL